jgi:hypothetical protein
VSRKGTRDWATEDPGPIWDFKSMDEIARCCAEALNKGRLPYYHAPFFDFFDVEDAENPFQGLLPDQEEYMERY